MPLPSATEQEKELSRLLQQLIRLHGEKQFKQDSLTHLLEKEPKEAVEELVYFLSRTLSEYVTMDVATWWIRTLQELYIGLTILKQHLERFGKSEKKVAVIEALCYTLQGFKFAALAMANLIERETRYIAFPIETIDVPGIGLTGLEIEPQGWSTDEEN